MTAPLLIGIAFAVVILPPLALIFWGVAHGFGKLSLGAAVLLSLAVSVALVAPLAALALADALSGPRACPAGNECYPYLYVWWIALPIGCAWAALVLAIGMLWGRSRRHTADDAPPSP